MVSDKGQEVYRRRVSANEKMYIAGSKLTPPFAIQMLVEGDGALSAKELKQALSAVGEANPGSRLKLKKQGLTKCIWEDSGVSPVVREMKCQWNGFDFESADFLREGFDLADGPTCEVLRFDFKDEKKIRLVFRAFHGVMDAQGVLHWVEEVFRCLRNEPLLGATSALTDTELAKALNYTDGYRPNFSLECASVTGCSQGVSKSFVWRRLRIPGSFPGIVSRLASILAKQSRLQEPNCPVRFMVPVDLRPHLRDSQRCTGNLSNPLFIEPGSDETWVDIYRGILESLEKKKEGMLGPIDHLLHSAPESLFRVIFSVLARFQRKKSRFMGTGVLSNIGKVTTESLSSDGFKATSVNFLPFDILIAPFSIVTTENDGHLELSVSMHEYLANHGRLDALLDILESELNAASAGPHSTIPTKMLLEEFNNTEAPVPEAHSIIELIRAQIVGSPDAIALVQNEKNLSYKELGWLIDQQMLILKKKGVKHSDLVGLVTNRSIDTVVNILAVLSLGAAFVPIDPAYPTERQSYIIQNSAIRLLIVDSESAVSAEYTGVIIPNAISAIGKEPVEAQGSQGAREDLAYVIYTSGSTGKPKGVEIENGQLIHYINWAQKVYTDGSASNFPLFTSLSFDLTITSIFVPLATGGTVYVYPEADPLLALNAILTSDKVDIIKLTPSHLRLMLELGVRPRRLQKLIVGGEDLATSLCEKVTSHFGSLRIFNEYGPTEATVGCMIHEYDPARDRDASVPIGKPADNIQIYVLDEDLCPVSSLATGEMYIAGAGLARGYLNRPSLTAERFIPNPFMSGQLMYKTGDIAKWRSDMRLEYLGRADDQVKINGFRIELGEVQAAIRSLDGVGEVAVLPVQVSGSPSWLCAFYVGREIEEKDIREQLKALLPNYMLPNKVSHIDEMPLTLNGKIDSRALIARLEASSIDNSNIQSGNMIEDVARIWADILNLSSPPDANAANFYDLGGDSLAMARMLRRVREEIVPEAHRSSFAALIVEVISQPTLEQVVSVIAKAELD